jgi:hypothetical protein
MTPPLKLGVETGASWCMEELDDPAPRRSHLDKRNRHAAEIL